MIFVAEAVASVDTTSPDRTKISAKMPPTIITRYRTPPILAYVFGDISMGGSVIAAPFDIVPDYQVLLAEKRADRPAAGPPQTPYFFICCMNSASLVGGTMFFIRR